MSTREELRTHTQREARDLLFVYWIYEEVNLTWIKFGLPGFQLYHCPYAVNGQVLSMLPLGSVVFLHAYVLSQ